MSSDGFILLAEILRKQQFRSAPLDVISVQRAILTILTDYLTPRNATVDDIRRIVENNDKKRCRLPAIQL
jgi:hypothetical protein